MIFIQVSIYKFLGNGPLWNKFSDDTATICGKYWWTTLLYIQNYVNPETMVFTIILHLKHRLFSIQFNSQFQCIPQTWYLSCDMQLYILSPILILPLLRWKKIGWINIVFWTLLSQIGVFVLAYENNWSGATIPL